jgi:hypothetical protein
MNAPSPTLQGSKDPPAAASAKGQIRSHTGLRGVAALLVVAYHQEFGPFYKLPFELSTNVFRRSGAEESESARARLSRHPDCAALNAAA